MKNKSKILSLLTLLILMLSLGACAHSGWEPIVETVQPQQVQVETTVAEQNILQDDGSFVTIPEAKKVEIKDVLIKSRIVNPAWETTIKTISQANTLLNPTPTAPLVGWALMGVSALLHGIAGDAKPKKERGD